MESKGQRCNEEMQYNNGMRHVCYSFALAFTATGCADAGAAASSAVVLQYMLSAAAAIPTGASVLLLPPWSAVILALLAAAFACWVHAQRYDVQWLSELLACAA